MGYYDYRLFMDGRTDRLRGRRPRRGALAAFSDHEGPSAPVCGGSFLRLECRGVVKTLAIRAGEKMLATLEDTRDDHDGVEHSTSVFGIVLSRLEC